MLSQFVRIPKKKCFADLDFNFPQGTNALGRLDENSEGLLILSNDKQLNSLLLKPENEHKRVYWVQVHKAVTAEELKTLEGGVKIRLNPNDYFTKPCQARLIEAPCNLAPRGHPISATLPSAWIELILTEGKFHQVRKMTASIGHQTLRLIRVSIEDVLLGDMKPGEVRELQREELFARLKISLHETF